MPLPVWTGGNVYFNGAKPCDIEEDYVVDTEHKIEMSLLVSDDGVVDFKSNVFEYLPEAKLICSDTLGMAFEPEERFEGPNGEDIIFDTDMFGKARGSKIYAGPICK